MSQLSRHGRHLGLLALLLLLCLGAAAARAEVTATTPQTEVRLVSAVTAVGDLAQIPLGIQMVLKSGWKTYWRSPGDAGFAPTIDTAGSQNVAAGT